MFGLVFVSDGQNEGPLAMALIYMYRSSPDNT